MMVDELMASAARWRAGESGKAGSPAEAGTLLSLHQGDNVGKTCQGTADTANFATTYTNATFGGQPGVAQDVWGGKGGCRDDVGMAYRGCRWAKR